MSAKSSIEIKQQEETAFITSEVTSADDTTIGYRQIGHGPGLVIMHGGGRALQHYMQLAELLVLLKVAVSKIFCGQINPN